MFLRKRNSFLSVFLFFYISSFAQNPIVSDFIIKDTDTFFVANLSEVEVLAFKNREERNRYALLKRRVFKVYPFALIAKDKLNEIKAGLDSIPKRRKKKKYTKAVAKFVKEEYADKLKKLSMSDGKVLVKLIYRETNISTYDIVKEYRGVFNAIFWQTMAKIWDNNLKTTYDPVNIREDMLIEHIILQAKIEGRF